MNFLYKGKQVWELSTDMKNLVFFILCLDGRKKNKEGGSAHC